MAKRLTIELLAMIALGLLIGLLGPFGTFNNPPAIRMLNWVMWLLAGYIFYRPTGVVAGWLCDATGLPPLGGRLIALIVKEFLALLKDPKSRTVLIGPPLIQLIVFGYAATFELKDIPYAVYNEDRGAVSRTLEAAFAGAPAFRQVATISSEREIAPLIDNRQALLVIHIAPRFSERLLSARFADIDAPLQVIIDGRNSNTAMLALNYVRGIVDPFNRQWLKERGLAGAPAVLESRAWFNPNLESRWFFVPGIIGMLALITTIRNAIVRLGIKEVCRLVFLAGERNRYKVKDPSFHNWMGLAMALRNQEISDFPLCNKSFNLSYCGYEL